MEDGLTRFTDQFLGRVVAFDLENILERFRTNAEQVTAQLGTSEILSGLSRSDVDICDLAVLHEATGHEYALFGRFRSGDEERVLVRGQPYRIHLPRSFLDEDVIWYAHSHPNDDVRPSDYDLRTLGDFDSRNGQQRSVIVTAEGSCRIFAPYRDFANEINTLLGINLRH